MELPTLQVVNVDGLTKAFVQELIASEMRGIKKGVVIGFLIGVTAAYTSIFILRVIF